MSSSSGGSNNNNNNNKSNKKIKKCNKDALLRTMRLLTTIDIVHEEEQHDDRASSTTTDDDDESSIIICFSLTKLGKCLRSRNSNKPSMASCIQHWMELPLWDSWLYLSDYIIEDDDDDDDDKNSDKKKNVLPFERANNGISSDYYYNENDHPESLKYANDFVKLIHEQEINAIVNWDYWSLHCRGKRLVDVGGHNGLLVTAIAQKEPTIDCYCLDLPEVISNSASSMKETTKQIIEQNNVTMVPGNVFDSHTIPSCDVILMKHFCDRCMWTDEETVQILKSCSSALAMDGDGDTGKIIIADAVLPDIGYNTQDAINDNEQQLTLYLDALYMLVGRERQRTKMEWEKLANLSNLNLISVHSTNVPSCSMIVMEKKEESGDKINK
ncbi:O-methyltransferase [Fragilariopsis cylindrus CCMP1102]|uniref:O-methyltransferase n=1 Tax=Fragilariopsis cylindrus CCMP1102 TaxID=635003 RepID=A0A1E7F4V1_9STRA|nr:O-methyltransferase [Fragilariopsis cylindrus CCMP1102]|eukprot:OEU13208.1 O-methyltransferase [Fragilariopsis cylindrus CCMP1102]